MSTSPSNTPSSSLKRSRTEDDDADLHLTPIKPPQLHDTPTSSGLSTPVTVQSTQDFVMASTTPAAVMPELASSSNPAPKGASMPTTCQKHIIPATHPPTKRRKTTSAEKAQKAAEKDAERVRKEAEREAERAKKEAEREAEKAKKEAEREAERVKKEAEREAKKAETKAKKDEEERKKAERTKAREEEKKAAADAKAAIIRAKEEEKLKKEKAQPRLNFFGFKLGNTPPAPLAEGKTLKVSASPVKRNLMTKDEARRRSMSVSLEPQSPSPAMAPVSSAPQAATNETEQTKAYRKHFLPFHVLKYTTVTPVTKFSREQLAESEQALNGYLASTRKCEPSWPMELPANKISRGYETVPVKDILSQLQGSVSTPVDLTEEGLNKHIDLSSQITMKYFDFSQDVRPPYSGTWTRPHSLTISRRLARNPFSTVLPEVDYEYDSEAEWDAGDGEDVDSDDEEEEVDDVEDDMDDFLDDEGAAELAKAKRGIMNTDLEPICSGLHWEDASGVLRPADGNDIITSFSELKMEFLLEPRPHTVDPFTTIYWDPAPSSASQTRDKSGLMQPPMRMPLKDRPGFANGANIPHTVGGVVPKAVKVASRKAAPAKVAPEYVSALKQYVDGRPDTKTGMLLNLKVKFSELTKAQIEHTLDEVAVRVGKVRKDQKWVLRENLP